MLSGAEIAANYLDFYECLVEYGSLSVVWMMAGTFFLCLH